MVENIFDSYCEGILRIIDLICEVTEISWIYDPKEMLYELSYLILVRIAEELYRIYILSAIVIIKYRLDDLVDLFVHCIFSHNNFSFISIKNPKTHMVSG